MSKETIGAPEGAGYENLNAGEFPTGGENESGDQLDKNASFEEQAFKNEFAEPGELTGMGTTPLQAKSALHDNTPLAKVQPTNTEDGEIPKTMLSKDADGNVITGEEREEGAAELTAEMLEGSSEDEVAELKRLNAELGTDFKSKNDLKQAIQKNDPVVNAADQMQTDRQEAVNYYNAVIAANDRDKVLANKRVTAQQKGVDTSTPEFKEALEAEVDTLEANGVLKSIAEMVQSNTISQRDRMQGEMDAYTTSKQASADQVAQEKKDKLFSAANDIYKKESFYGLKVEQKDIVSAYKTVSDNKLVDQINSDDNLAIEVALFIANRGNFDAVSKQPSYSEGVNAVFNKVKGTQTNASSKSGNTRNSNNHESNHISAFVK